MVGVYVCLTMAHMVGPVQYHDSKLPETLQAFSIFVSA